MAARASWALALETGAQGSMRTPHCQDELPADYERLFDDEAIAAAHI